MDHHELRNRSKPPTTSGWQLLLAWLPVLAFLDYTVWTHFNWGLASALAFIGVFFTVIGLLITYFLLSGIYWRSFTQYAPAAGRVLAIVPGYNEEPELIHAAIRALLRQTILPDQIVVVDDGSAVPIPEYHDPLIRWLRVPNGGKRHAQAHALRLFEPGEFDFILTVDSDSVLDEDALEHMLRAMEDSRIQACTGMIFMRNWNTNFLTRLTDINVVTSCLLFRMSRSILGIVTPTSGALALYRSEIIYDNLDDYLNSGTAGDDRRLSFYALQRGQVVGVSEAVVCTELPDTWRGIFHQRLRWSKSAWLGIPFVLTNLRWLALVFYMFPLVFSLMFPFVLITLVTAAIRFHNTVLYQGLLFWEVCAITQTAIYAIYRPGFTTRQKLTQWALSPVYPILGMIILRPAAYWALTKLKSDSWHTREVPSLEIPPPTTTPPEKVVVSEQHWLDAHPTEPHDQSWS